MLQRHTMFFSPLMVVVVVWCQAASSMLCCPVHLPTGIHTASSTPLPLNSIHCTALHCTALVYTTLYYTAVQCRPVFIVPNCIISTCSHWYATRHPLLFITQLHWLHYNTVNRLHFTKNYIFLFKIFIQLYYTTVHTTTLLCTRIYCTSLKTLHFTTLLFAKLPNTRAPENLKLAGNLPRVAAMYGLQNLKISIYF